MRRKSAGSGGGHMVGGLFTFALFGLFVTLSLLIVVIGADGYRRVVDAAESATGLRTSLGYVAGKVRSEAAADGARILNLEGGDALALTQINDRGEALETVIYYQDGALYESYYNASMMEFNPAFGTRLTEIASFTFQWVQENLLELTATAADGDVRTLCLAVRAAPGREGP